MENSIIASAELGALAVVRIMRVADTTFRARELSAKYMLEYIMQAPKINGSCRLISGQRCRKADGKVLNKKVPQESDLKRIQLEQHHAQETLVDK